MTYINPTKSKTSASPLQSAANAAKTKSGHLNFMGGVSYDLSNPLTRLRIVASSCFFGEPMYYKTDEADKRPKRQSGAVSVSPSAAVLAHLRTTLHALDPRDDRYESPAQMMESVIDEALAFDAESTLREAARLRNEDHMRTTPQVILVRAANTPSVKRTGLIRQYASDIIKRADEPSVGLAYQIARYGKPIPNSLKKAWRDRLASFDDYQIAKYRQKGRAVKTADVVSLTHAKSDTLDALMKDTLRTTGETWEAITSKVGASTESWTEALPQMGHMALLRNLRNLVKHQVPAELFTAKLTEGAKSGQQLPFRYFSAYNALKEAQTKREIALIPPSVLDAVEESLEISVGNLPRLKGRVMSLCDNSGSAWGAATSTMGTMEVARIANLTGVLTGKCADEGYVGVFGDNLKVMPVQKRDSVLSQAETFSEVGRKQGLSTENGIWMFWDNAIKKQEHWDHVFIYSDMQAGHGGLYGTVPSQYSDYIWRNGHQGHTGRYIDVPKLIAAYREKVNPNVMVYMVQVAGYADTLVPEFYDRSFILGGWGEGLLRFAFAMSEAYDQATFSEMAIVK